MSLQPADGPEIEQGQRGRRDRLGDAAFDYYMPLELVRGEGVYLFDSAGQRYLDMYNNLPSVGHGHPEVVSAIAAQAATLNTNSRYLNKTMEAYAARLLRLFPAPLGNLVMTCSGSEANDLALRIAFAATGCKGIIVTAGACHGSTAAAIEVSPGLRERLPAHVRAVPAPDQRLAGQTALGSWFAARVYEQVQALREAGFGLAALVVDSAFAADGVFTDPPGFLAEAVGVVRAAGGLFIADEVMAGFGRTGALWGFSRHGVVPDLVTLGKPMGNGYPTGGVVAQDQHLAYLKDAVLHFNPSGGTSVAAAAGMAVLDVIEDKNLVRNSVHVGQALRKGLRRLAKSFPQIAAVRGAGLLTGVDLVARASGAPDAEMSRRAVNALRQNFILAGTAGPRRHALQFRPPLTFAADHVAQFLDIFARVLATLGQAG